MALCSKAARKIKQLKKFYNEEIVTKIDIAIQLVDNIKKVVDSPVLDVITAITPTKLDNEILYKLRKGLNVGLAVLNINNTCNHPDLAEKLNCYIAQIRLISPELRNAVYLKLASIVTSHLDGKANKEHVYDMLVQTQYAATKG